MIYNTRNWSYITESQKEKKTCFKVAILVKIKKSNFLKNSEIPLETIPKKCNLMDQSSRTEYWLFQNNDFLKIENLT